MKCGDRLHRARLLAALSTTSMQIFNSYTGRKEELRPIEPGVVRMYVCGDTVYDFCHVGHARSKVAFDIVRRYLQYRGYKVVVRPQHHRHRRQDHQARRRRTRKACRR